MEVLYSTGPVVWIGGVLGVLGWLCLESNVNPRSGRHYLLTVEGYRAQGGHDDFWKLMTTALGNFVSIMRAEGLKRYVYIGSHLCFFYLENAGRSLQLLGAGRNQYSSEFCTFGYGHMEQAGIGWRATHDLWYHIYFISVQKRLKDAMVIANQRSFSYRPALKSEGTGIQICALVSNW